MRAKCRIRTMSRKQHDECVSDLRKKIIKHSSIEKSKGPYQLLLGHTEFLFTLSLGGLDH